MSKVSHIQFNELAIQNYLKPECSLTVQESQFIFLAQCRMLQVGENYRSNNTNNSNNSNNSIYPIFPVCCDPATRDSQQHLMNCHKLMSSDLVNDDIKYDDLFSQDLSKQIVMIRVMMKNMGKREDILERKSLE